MDKHLTIRFSNQDDVPLIFKFVKSLAKYVKLLDEVAATEIMLSENLFNKRYAEVIIAQLDSKPIGFALYFHNFSTFLGRPGIFIEDLFIEEEYRGNGFGKEILTYLARLAVDRGCGRLEWSVLDWDEKAMRFYRSIDASPRDQSTVYRLEGAKLTELARHY
jgi:GNAT superfamily N-acetyltransferase